MKVTVYFSNVRVIVPCGQGDILVRDLMDMAITRYKKATGKPSSSIVRIRNLKSSRDDGILFPDDCLSDVVDDREQIIADYEENDVLSGHYNCGDGTSTSSVCTGSPDLFSVEVSSHGSVQYAHSDVEIAEDSGSAGGAPLQVRRGSEPALNNLCPSSPTTDPSKRWSTAVVINQCSQNKEVNSSGELESPPNESLLVNGDSKSPRNFSRSSGRLSILGNNPETYRWVQAADRQLVKDLNDKLSIDPLVVSNRSGEPDSGSDGSTTGEEREQTIVLKNESGPLGIHVVPDCDVHGRDTGLVIQSIEAGGRIDRDGRFHVGDRIVEINGNSLRSVSFQAAQEIFKNALKTPEIKLELLHGCVRQNSKCISSPKKPPPPVYPKPSLLPDGVRKVPEDSTLVEGEERAGGVSTKVATVTPTKKMPVSSAHRLATANTRRIGKKMHIQLKKGAAGLGFSITTRDNPAGGNSPVYIKNVLPKGAAIEDGKLQPGDRLLEVNGIEMTGKSQAEAVQILRNAPQGSIVDLIVSRQEPEILPISPDAEQEGNTLAVKLEDESGIFPWKHREILTFQIPLNDTGSAGLGISVKGKSTSNSSSGSVELGIFIKAVIPGGAASKDGRLKPNDQLVNINGISLLGMSNSNAMETLRKAMMQLDGPIPNAIILTIARRINPPSEDDQDKNSVHSRTSNMNSQGSVRSDLSSKASDKADSRKDCSAKYVEPTERSVTNHQTNTKPKDLYSSQKVNTNPPGCNPIIERLTGQTVNGHVKSGPYSYANHNEIQQGSTLLDKERNRMPYSPTINVTPHESVLIEDEYCPSTEPLRKTCGSADNILLQNAGRTSSESNDVVPASSQLSLEEGSDGFARDGFGRQSMSEKRHAQLDAKNTDTYQRNKKAREERERSRHTFDKEYSLEHQQHSDSSHGKSVPQLTSSYSALEDEPRGPSLGLRKSSSLESLQTMIQELNKDDEALKNTLQSANTRGSRSRGCNESFRAAVDRSYEAPAPATMETLDEESESGSSVGHVLGRTSEMSDGHGSGISRDAFHEDLLNMYCRGSKSSKKKSLLRGLGSVFKFGKNKKNGVDLKGKVGDEISHEIEHIPQLMHLTASKEQDRVSEHDHKVNDIQKKALPAIPRDQSSSSIPLESMPNRQERMQSLREQHQRLHQKRQGHYPLEHKEELYESEIQAKENRQDNMAKSSSIDIAHARSHSHDEIESRSRHPYNDTNSYSHYMNYKEIQQHMNQYYHPDPIQVQKMHRMHNSAGYLTHRSVPHPDRPSSNFFEYESVQQLHKLTASQVPESESGSLPRSTRSGVDQTFMHMRAQQQQQQHKPLYSQKSMNSYERQHAHHYYPNSALYNHVVPGSKV